MNDGLLSAIESINKVNKDFASALESPWIGIIRSQQQWYKKLNPLSEITDMHNLFARPEWMNAISVKPNYWDALKPNIIGGTFERLNNFDSISAISSAVNQNHTLYSSFLDSVNITSSFLNVSNTLNMQAGNLALLSLVKPDGLSDFANIRVSDLLVGNVFKKLIDYGAEDRIDDFGTIAQAIISDDELSQRVRDYFEESNNSISGEESEYAWKETYNPAFWMAVKICRKTGLPLWSVYLFFFTIGQIAYDLISNRVQNSILGSSENKNPIEIQNIVYHNYHYHEFSRIEIAVTDGSILAFARQDSRLVAEFCEGQMVEVLEKKRKWMRIAYLDEETLEPKSGWVGVENFAQFIEEEVASEGE